MQQHENSLYNWWDIDKLGNQPNISLTMYLNLRIFLEDFCLFIINVGVCNPCFIPIPFCIVSLKIKVSFIHTTLLIPSSLLIFFVGGGGVAMCSEYLPLIRRISVVVVLCFRHMVKTLDGVDVYWTTFLSVTFIYFDLNACYFPKVLE